MPVWGQLECSDNLAIRLRFAFYCLWRVQVCFRVAPLEISLPHRREGDVWSWLCDCLVWRRIFTVRPAAEGSPGMWPAYILLPPGSWQAPEPSSLGHEAMNVCPISFLVSWFSTCITGVHPYNKNWFLWTSVYLHWGNFPGHISIVAFFPDK